jgi:hypothetical protein
MHTPQQESERRLANDFAIRVRERDCVCKHGHFGCSDREGGRCLDEWFSELGLDNNGEWLDD